MKITSVRNVKKFFQYHTFTTTIKKHVSIQHSQDKEGFHKIISKEDKEQSGEKHEEVNKEVTEDNIHVKIHMEENKKTKKGMVFVFGKSS